MGTAAKMDRRNHSLIALAIGSLLFAVLPGGAAAQSLDYGSGVGSSGGGSGDGPVSAGAVSASAVSAGADGSGEEAATDTRAPHSGRHSRRERIRITPYIEANQIFSAQLSPRHEVLTWTAVAAGVDGHIKGRNSEASFSARYEHRFGWGKSDNSDTISGLVRGSVALVPQAVSFEAGGLATRTSIDVNGASLPGGYDRSRATNLYSVYAGPSVKTHAGDVAVTGSYRIGYTQVGTSNNVVASGVPAGGDVFDHSTTHMADVHAGVSPGEVLPVGIGVGAGFYQENIANLDQRVQDFHARADVTVPVSQSVAVVGGVGYEKVEISSRDAVRDANGVPLVGGNGRYVTDNSRPRQIAYESSGLIWDVGVIWRPSRRTAFEAHYGRRYGSETIYGSFGWRPTSRSAFNLSVYDNVAGFGGQVNRALVALPTDFEASRDPVTGDINGCVTPGAAQSGAAGASPVGGGNCITGALGSVRSATFRARGVQGSYSLDLGRLGMGVAAGYDRRKFIAAPGTVLASANGVTDTNTWVSAWLNGRIDRNSSFGTYIYADWYHSEFAADGDGQAYGITASYSRSITQHLSANAALALQGITRERVDDIWNASAIVGVRYSF